MLTDISQEIITKANAFYIDAMDRLAKSETFGISKCKTTWDEMINLNMIINALAEGSGQEYTQAQFSFVMIGGDHVKNWDVIQPSPSFEVTPFNSTVYTSTQVATQYAAYINSHTFGITATSSGPIVTIYGTTGAAQNGQAFGLNIYTSGSHTPALQVSGVLSGGQDTVPAILTLDQQTCLLAKLQTITAKGF